MCLCYEVWENSRLVAAYWDVKVAWLIANSMKSYLTGEIVVIVANGIDIANGVQRKRSDVLGTLPKEYIDEL